MPRGAVSLDDKALPGPAEVWTDSPTETDQRLIHIRVRQTPAQQQVQHEILEFAAGRRRTGRNKPGELLGPPMAIRASEKISDLAHARVCSAWA